MSTKRPLSYDVSLPLSPSLFPSPYSPSFIKESIFSQQKLRFFQLQPALQKIKIKKNVGHAHAI